MTRRRLTIALLFIGISTISVTAQKQDYHWYFGLFAGIDFNTPGPTPLMGAMEQIEGCASVSDRDGNLLFYSNGFGIWDRQHTLMPDGTSLQGGISSSHSAVIVPLPGRKHTYYLFTAQDHSEDGGLAYSIVDMNLNNGFGDIVPGTKNTLLLDRTSEKIVAILHSNGRDVWIITHTFDSNQFYAFLLTPFGFTSPPVISALGATYGPGLPWYTGQIRASHGGTKIAANVSFAYSCEMFDFNRTTGILSNPVSLQFPVTDTRVYGMEFSPNDSLLYLGCASLQHTNNTLLQYNYLDANPEFHVVSTLVNDGTEFYGSLQLAPDGKIYMTQRFQSALDVIHQPNRRGNACQYEEFGFDLLRGTAAVFGLPSKIITSTCEFAWLGPDIKRCIGDSVVLALDIIPSASCPFTHSWSTGESGDHITVHESGTYWIEIVSPDTTYRDSVNVLFDPVVTHEIAATICANESFEGYSLAGTYQDTFTASFGCDSIRILALTVLPVSDTLIEKTILQGGFFEGYNTSGIYRDTFVNVFGCDSIRIIHLHVVRQTPIINYSLNACQSVMADGTHMDYSEFTATYPNPLICASVDADPLYRVSPEKHSCTPGIDDNPAMCVTTLNSCTYTPGSSKSVIIEFTIDPPPDSAVQITQFSFFEKSPTEYTWINGPSGPNNRPQYYGIRILKNGVEIFKDEQQPTQTTWNLELYLLHERKAFRCDSVSHFRIELLPYCPVGNGAVESVWDLDNITIQGSCLSPLREMQLLRGVVRNQLANGMPGVRVDCSSDVNFTTMTSDTTDAEGRYAFTGLESGLSYYVRCYKNDHLLENVSANDLVQIKKHLLGLEPFRTLRDLVAADINHNEAVNAMDIVLLQKSLLGMNASFPNNTSWRFGIWPQDFRKMDLPSFKEVYYIESLNTSVKKLDFIGVKVGNLE